MTQPSPHSHDTELTVNYTVNPSQAATFLFFCHCFNLEGGWRRGEEEERRATGENVSVLGWLVGKGLTHVFKHIYTGWLFCDCDRWRDARSFAAKKTSQSSFCSLRRTFFENHSLSTRVRFSLANSMCDSRLLFGVESWLSCICSAFRNFTCSG